MTKPMARQADRHDVAANGAECARGIRVYLVAEVRFYREVLATTLANESELWLVGSGRLADLLVAHTEMQADVILVDHGCPRAAADLARVVEAFPDAKLIALAVGESDEELVQCARMGAFGFVGRDESVEAIVNAIRSLDRGTVLCPERLLAALLDSAGCAPIGNGHRACGLTERQRQIVELIGQGLSNKEIAHRLHIALPTVKNHVHNILERLDVRRRSEAVAHL